LIELREVSKRFGELEAVTSLSLTVEPGELLVLLGGSGSGKTTTLKMVNRLIDPSSGAILLDGEDIADIAPHALRRHIGYVFQRLGLFPHMSVAENIAVTPSLLGWDAERISERVDELLRLVELDTQTDAETETETKHEMRDRPVTELSGGQQQRVGVARALAAKPKLMLLDEPFGALDPITRERLQHSFVRIRKELDLTAIFVTHDMLEALLMGDRIAVMHEGRLAQIGTPRELMQAPATEYVEQLISTPKRQADAVERLLRTRDDEVVS
jgi:osmoprotectant transport system ATP-binding protein